jgi:hypothetical protein
MTLANKIALALAFIAALGAIENSYAYGAIGAALSGQNVVTYAACGN